MIRPTDKHLYIETKHPSRYGPMVEEQVVRVLQHAGMLDDERIRRLEVAEAAASNEGMGGSLAGAGVGLGVGQQMGAALNPEQAALQQQQQMMMQQMMMQGGMPPPGQAQGGEDPRQPRTGQPQRQAGPGEASHVQRARVQAHQATQPGL